MPVIAFCGTRGVPASYGGFETAVDEISRRLVADGRTCEVFCRAGSSDDRPPEHDGRLLAYVRGSRWRTLDTVVSSLQTGWKLWRMRDRYAHVFWFNNANLPGILMTRVAGIPMSVNTDGLEWRRAKWRAPFKAYYFVGSALITRLCRSLISDSRAIQSYYRDRFGAETVFIPYGAPHVPDVTPERSREILAGWGVESGRYFLQITRVEPDNLPLEIAGAYVRSGLGARGYRMLSIGYKDATPYALKLRALDGQQGLRVAEAVYDPEVLRVLRAHCCAYLHGNSVGGTNPALLEAMSACPRIAAIDGEFSREVLGDTGWFFRTSDLHEQLGSIADSPARGAALAARVWALYRWDAVASSYGALADGAPVEYEGLL